MAVNLMNSEQLFRISGRDVIFNIILKRRSSWNQIQYCLPLLNAGMVDHNLDGQVFVNLVVGIVAVDVDCCVVSIVGFGVSFAPVCMMSFSVASTSTLASVAFRYIWPPLSSSRWSLDWSRVPSLIVAWALIALRNKLLEPALGTHTMTVSDFESASSTTA